MIDLNYIVDPLIGTLIGFGTNYLAVKMLFRPYKPIKIGKLTLPFTPGVIPKRKGKLASAFGKAISNEIFTGKDIQEIFLTENVKNIVINTCMNELINEDNKIKDVFLKNVDEEKYFKIKNDIAKILSKKIVNGLINIDLGNIISKEGASSIKSSLKGSFFGNFVSDEKIFQISKSAGEKINEYIKFNGESVIFPYITKEIDNIENKTLLEIFEENNINNEDIENILKNVYSKIIKDKMNGIFNSFNISEVIENKINEMDVKEIEKLFMNVMKKELSAIVNLGAVLGFLLGVINIFL